jgi:hypothetical protein
MEYVLVALIGIFAQSYMEVKYDIQTPVYERQCFGGSEQELLKCSKIVQEQKGALDE